MIETITGAAKYKALIVVFSLIILGVAYSDTDNSGQFGGGRENNVLLQETQDPFTQDIQTRSDLVYSAVMEAVSQQGKQSPLVYKQTCESAGTVIQSERLDTNTNYNTLNAEQKELIQEYRDYLQEAARVVSVAYSGETPDLSKMNELKNKLI